MLPVSEDKYEMKCTYSQLHYGVKVETGYQKTIRERLTNQSRVWDRHHITTGRDKIENNPFTSVNYYHPNTALAMKKLLGNYTRGEC